MNASLFKATAASISLVMLGGCANTPDGQLAQGQGAAIGALAGGLLGYAVGGERGALIGAGLGGAAGFAYGTQIAKKKAQYANLESWMQGEIAAARDKNDAMISYNNDLRNRIARLERRANSARANGDKAAITSIRSEVRELQSEVTGTNKAFGEQTGYYNAVAQDADAKKTGQTSSLSSVVSEMRSNQNAISSNSRRLAQLDNQLTL